MTRWKSNEGLALLTSPPRLQHELMPIPSYKDDGVDLGGRLEPAYEIAGDAFDYAINGGSVYFGVFDAVGHGLKSALLTSIAVGAFRLHRRRLEPLEDVAQAIDYAVGSVADLGQFVTAVIGRVDLDHLTLELVNAGHLPPTLIRDGQSHQIDVDAEVPYGIGRFQASSSTLNLQPGDAVYAFSDGIIEAYDDDRVTFGSQALFSILEQRERDHIPVQHVCKSVLQTVLGHVGGRLRDDATIFGIRLAG